MCRKQLWSIEENRVTVLYDYMPSSCSADGARIKHIQFLDQLHLQGIWETQLRNKHDSGATSFW